MPLIAAEDLSDYLRAQALDPRWEEATRVHDWRNHIGGRIKGMWETFTQEQKFALVEDADERASAEHWE